jgi:hypothetical protein
MPDRPGGAMPELAVTITMAVLIPADGYEGTLAELLAGVERAAEDLRLRYEAPAAARGVTEMGRDVL